MLPRLLDENERAQEGRPSLPSIRDLFGEHLARPTNKPAPFTFLPPRSSSFSLADLGSSLPANSRPSSPSESPGWPSPRSTWSQASGYHGTAPFSPRRHSDASSAPPSTSSIQDQFVMLPPIVNHSRNASGFTAAWRPTSSSRRAYENHSRARSTSEAMAERESRDSYALLDVSKRRHTIGSARGPSPVRFPYPTDFMSKPSTLVSSSAIRLPYAPRQPATHTYSSSSASIRGLSSVIDNYRESSAPSPPTSGEDVSIRRRSPAKYQCQVCGKRFNRPSSLKIHHNTHTGEKPFPCLFPGCGRNFSVLSNMRRHARIHGSTYPQQPREGSADEIPDMPSPSYSSASSAHTTPIISNASISRSYPSSASSSPGLSTFLNLPSSSRQESRHSTVTRPHPYNVSPPPSSDDDGSSFEQ